MIFNKTYYSYFRNSKDDYFNEIYNNGFTLTLEDYIKTLYPFVDDENKKIIYDVLKDKFPIVLSKKS